MVQDANEVLAANVRRLRRARAVSMRELADTSGIALATLSAIEAGQGNPRFDTLAALAGALSVDIGELADPPGLGGVRVVLPADAPREPLAGATAHVLERTSSIEALFLELAAGHEGEIPGAAGSRRAVYVLKGRVETGPVERPSQVEAATYIAFPGETATLVRTDRRGARLLFLDIRG